MIDENGVLTGGNLGKTSPSAILIWLANTVIQGDSKRWTRLKSKRRLNTRQTVGCGGISSSLLVLRADKDETHAAQQSPTQF
jgi:hypothetical protein